MFDIKLKKREAADFLNRKGRRIELIFFGLVLIFVTIVPFYLYSYLEYLFWEVYTAIKEAKIFTPMYTHLVLSGLLTLAAMCSGLFALFVTAPVYSCFFDFSYKIYRDGASGKQRYLSFGKRGYWGAFRSGLIFLLIFILCLAPVILSVIIGKWLATADDVRIVTLVNNLFFILLAIGLAAGFLVFILFKPFFLFGYYVAKGKKVIESLSLSVKKMKNPRASEMYFAYIKSFIPSLLLSLVTLLVLFLLDTLPKMMTVYFDVSEDIAYGE